MRVEADVRRGRWRGHLCQLTADLTMLEHRPDCARALYDSIPAFRNRLRETGEEDSDAVELTAESLQHLPMYIAVRLGNRHLQRVSTSALPRIDKAPVDGAGHVCPVASRHARSAARVPQ